METTCSSVYVQQSSIRRLENEVQMFEDRFPTSKLLKNTCTQALDKNSCGESCLPSKCLELIVSDVLHWQAQIKAILSYASSSSSEKTTTTGFLEDSSDLLKFRVTSLTKENEELIGKCDKTARDIVKTEDSMVELLQELEHIRTENLDKDRQLKELKIQHEKEVHLLKQQISQFQNRDQLLKKIINHNPCELDFDEWCIQPYKQSTSTKDPTHFNSIAPNTPDISISSRKTHARTTEEYRDLQVPDNICPETAYLQVEIQRLQETIHRLEAHIDTKVRSTSRILSRTRMRRNSDVGDQFLKENTYCKQNDASKIPKPAQNRPMSACSFGDVVRSSSNRLLKLSARTPTFTQRAVYPTTEAQQLERGVNKRTSETGLGQQKQSGGCTSMRRRVREKPMWRP
eukprot:g5753.t1